MKRIFYKTGFLSWLKAVADFRDQRKITYRPEALLLFVTKLGARRQINFNFNSVQFIRNLSRLR